MIGAAEEQIPGWGLVSAIAAPVLLIGGWTVAAGLQRGGFDQIADTISDLAARDADQRWVMTAALVGVGGAHVISALALRPAARAGRLVLAAGGVATALVAAAPLPAGGGASRVHGIVAGIAFVCLAVWPALSWRSPEGAGAAGPGGPAWPWRRPVALTATVVLLIALGWFFVQLRSGGDLIGLSERVAAASQALWPLAAIASGRLATRSPA